IDLDKVWKYLVELFGWEPVNEFSMGAAGVYRTFGKNGIAYGGIYSRSDDSKVQPYWLPYVRVADANKAADAITKGGGVITSGPMDVPGGNRVAVFRDPQSVICGIQQRKGE